MIIDHIALSIPCSQIDEQDAMKTARNILEKGMIHTAFDSLPIKMGFYGFQYRIESENGMIYQYGMDSWQGIHIVINGKTLQRYQAGKWIDMESDKPSIIDRVDRLMEAFKNTKIARLDIAMDNYEQGSYMELYEAIRAGQYKSKLRNNVRYVLDDNNHGTIYLGKRGRETFIRIYDKSLEQGIKDGNWVRLEFEFRSGSTDKAKRAYDELKKGGIVSMMKASLDMESPVYQSFFDDDIEKHCPYKKQNEDGASLSWLNSMRTWFYVLNKMKMLENINPNDENAVESIVERVQGIEVFDGKFTINRLVE